MSELSESRWRRAMAEVFGELNALYDADKIGAVHISIALRDGDVRTLRAFDDGFKILLIAAAAIGAKETLEIAARVRDPDNWETPA